MHCATFAFTTFKHCCSRVMNLIAPIHLQSKQGLHLARDDLSTGRIQTFTRYIFFPLIGCMSTQKPQEADQTCLCMARLERIHTSEQRLTADHSVSQTYMYSLLKSVLHRAQEQNHSSPCYHRNENLVSATSSSRSSYNHYITNTTVVSVFLWPEFRLHTSNQDKTCCCGDSWSM